MLAKLAISFVTFNRGKHIKENLEQIVNETEKRGIDIYIFDGSTNKATERIANIYIEKGYKHIKYYHYENNFEESQQRMRDALLLPDSEYIWFCGDKFVVAPSHYETILKYIHNSYDIITIYHSMAEKIRIFSDPEEYIEYSIIPLTHFGASIIKKNLLKNNDIPGLRKQFPGFWRLMLYVKAIDQKNFTGITINIKKNDLTINSKFNTQSASRLRMWETWIEDWYYTIMRLPKRYFSIRKKLLNRPDKDCCFFELKELIKQKAQGQFDLQKVISDRKYITDVILLPYEFVFFISLIPKEWAKLILFMVYHENIS